MLCTSPYNAVINQIKHIHAGHFFGGITKPNRRNGYELQPEGTLCLYASAASGFPLPDGGVFTTTNPANGQVLAQCAEATQAGCDAAVKAAWAAYPGWKAVSPSQRADILMKIADRIDANAELLAQVETMDNGKPIRETSAIDVPIPRTTSAISPAPSAPARAPPRCWTAISQPGAPGAHRRGGADRTLELPLLYGRMEAGPVLASGDCVVFKSSSNTPEPPGVHGADCRSAPRRVVNVITGTGSKSGQYILEHPGFRKLAFTGSTEVGVSVAMAAAEQLIPATLELGGKSANIYFDDCQWDKAWTVCSWASCSIRARSAAPVTRVFVQEGIYDKFGRRGGRLRKGSGGRSSGSQYPDGRSDQRGPGPKNSPPTSTSPRKRGATIACGGERYTEGECAKGCFMKPTLITNVTNDMRVAQEEIFGPVAVVIKFKTEEKGHRHGQRLHLWPGRRSLDPGHQPGHRCLSPLRPAVCGSTPTTRSPPAPLRWLNRPGIGRENDLRILDAYSQTKNIMINLNLRLPSGFYPAK